MLNLALVILTLGMASTHGQEREETPVKPRIRVHLNGSFVKAFYGMNREEVRALIGPPKSEDKDGYIYDAVVPGQFAELEGFFLIWFAGDRARAFQIDTQAALQQTFVDLALKQAPTAKFVREFGTPYLSGEHWRDNLRGYFAAYQASPDHWYILTIDVTPAKERSISPFWRRTDR